MAKAYIFDMDGTLVDNCAWHVKAWRAFAVRHGREITEQQILEWMGSPSVYYMNRMSGHAVPGMRVAAITATLPREVLATEHPDILFGSFAGLKANRLNQ